MKSLTLVVVILCHIYCVFCATGIDISMADCGNLSQNQWNCMVETYNNTFAIIEAFDGGYEINHNIAKCVSDAAAAGFEHIDVYAFLCPNCGYGDDCSTPVNNLIDYLSSNNVKYGMLWFDVEQCTGCWDSYSTNFGFLQNCVNTAVSRNVSIGIYSSYYEWGVTMGDATGLQDYPLWYADWDGQLSFDDFLPFGGWTTPQPGWMKQYADHGDNSCNVPVDLDWYPD